MKEWHTKPSYVSLLFCKRVREKEQNLNRNETYKQINNEKKRKCQRIKLKINRFSAAIQKTQVLKSSANDEN